MAFVYEATDLRHGRRVAIKALKPEISSSMGAERFLREITIVARLSHPNVMPLHDSGEVDGLLYYVMPLVTGETLQERMRRDPALSLNERIRIFREVAQALSYAHGHGVVHRDLKPANIMLSGGVAVVTDFGIARVSEDVGAQQLTQTGLAIGTPTYMSPEQAMGDAPIDARSDVYSLGCILYEMLAGRPPYEGKTALALISQHTGAPVPDLAKVRPDLPPELSFAVARALAKAPDARFASIEAFVGAVSFETGELGATKQRTRRFIWRYVAGAAVLIAAASGVWWRSGAPGRVVGTDAIPRLVVLPFAHVGPEDTRYLTDGVSDEVSNRIAQIGGIAVVSRASAQQFNGERDAYKEFAAKLNVTYVLMGSVHTDRGPTGAALIKVTPRLFNVETEAEIPLDTEGFEAELQPGGIFEMQAKIARSVARGLTVALSPEAIEALALRPTTDLQAYSYYLRGIAHAAQFLVREEQVKAIEMFENAVRIDPTFALAFARLAQVQALFWVVFDRTPDRQRRWKAALDRAMDLAPELTQTRVALGQWHFYAQNDADAAMSEIAELRRQQPNDTELLWLLARVQRTQGDFEGALKSFDDVAALDPRSSIFPFESATALTMLGRFDSALERVDQAALLSPEWLPPKSSRPRLLLLLGRVADARALMERMTAERDVFLPQYINEPLYRDLWDSIIPEGFQAGLARISLAAARSDSADYYQVKGRLYARRNNTALQRAYSDSALRVLMGRRQSGALGVFTFVELGNAHWGAGHLPDARAYADSAWDQNIMKQDAFRGWFATLELARLYARLGDNGKAFDVLERIKLAGQILPAVLLETEPAFAGMMDQPRMRALLGAP